jgi:hypothetical protein
MGDWKADQERERQVRLDRAKQIQKADPRDHGVVGTTHSLYERKQVEGQARIDAARRDQARDFLTRRNGVVPDEAAIDAALGKGEDEGQK